MLTKTEDFDFFKRTIESAKSEADIRRAWDHLITSSLKIKSTIHEEDGYKDYSFDNVVIEFKDKGFFRHSKDSIKFKEATDGRILKYIKRWSKKIDKPTSAFIGIATDGIDTSIVKVINNEIESGELLSLSKKNIDYILTVIEQNQRIPLTSENLINDFGVHSELGYKVLHDLYFTLKNDLSEEDINKTKLFFNEWKNLYGQVANIAKWKQNKILDSLNFPQDAELSEVLFTFNTYNSFLVKLIAAELVSTLKIASYNNFAEHLGLSGENIFQQINFELEKNGFFELSGIHNFVSEVLFSWYTESINKPCTFADDLSEICLRLSVYDLNENKAMKSGDLLKHFYQNLVPDELRRSLGEFYTPDWLVEYMLDKLPELENSTILDPTNGSGSFILQAIEQKKRYFSKSKMSAEDQLKNILSQVYGFDLNPLAVQTAKVNYLFAIYDLLQECSGIEVEIPILLADAIYAPKINAETGNYEYTIGSEVANLKVELPKKIVDNRSQLVKSFNIMNNAIESGRTFKSCLGRLTNLFPDEAKDFFDTLQQVFNKIQTLHERSWDGIWFQIIQNFFWSIELPKFDFIIGNPPWVRWSSLPELYRQRVKTTALSYDIFSEHKRYGGNELDISALVTYTVADRWLKEDGTISFLLPQNHLQNDSSSGFRQFKIQEYALDPVEVEDLSDLKIFEDATNKPMIFTAKKVKGEVHYPVKYDKWESVGGKKTISVYATTSEILNERQVDYCVAEPIDDTLRGRWIYGSENQLWTFKRIVGNPTYEGRKGITTDLNGIFFPKLLQKANGLVQIETRPSAGRTDIGPAFKAWIEEDMVYPLAKGSKDIKHGKFDPQDSLVAIVPNKGIKNSDYLKAENKLDELPRTKAYFKRYENLLSQRSTFKKFMPGAPYWAVYNVGEYTFSPYKVSWSEIGTKVNAALLISQNNTLEKEIVIPDHKLFFASFDDADEALFLTGLLNSSIISQLVAHSTVSTSRGNILKSLNLPLFNAQDEWHNKVVQLIAATWYKGIDLETQDILDEIVSYIL